MRAPHRSTLALLAALVLVGSCVGGDAPTDVDGLGNKVSLPIQATIVPTAVDGEAAPINRIRAVAERVPDGAVLDSVVLNVSPTSDSWEISLSVSATDPTLQVVVYLQLINVDATGRETVQYSGRTAPFGVAAGRRNEPTSVEVVRGPLDNLAVTGVTISGAPSLIFEKDSVRLSAQVTTDGTPASPRIFWASLDPGVASVTAAGLVRTVMPGTAHVVASAGVHADTVDFEVWGRPARAVVTPDTITVVGSGADATFAAQVVDRRGSPVADQNVLWRSLDPTIAESLGNGRFRSGAAGYGRVEARVAADSTVKGTAILHVQAVSTDLSLTKTAASSSVEVGDTVDFKLVVSNVGGTATPGVHVLDSLPGGLIFVSASTATGTVDATGSRWNVGDMSAGGSATLTLRALVRPGAAGALLTNVARAVPGAGFGDDNPGDNRATASVTVTTPAADVGIAKTVNKPSPSEGDTVVFTVVASNAGPLDVPLAEITDTLPTGLTLVDASVTSGSLNALTGLWTLALDSATSATLKVVAAVDAGTEGKTLTNTARVTSLPGLTDPSSGNDQGSASVQVLPAIRADVQVKKVVNDAAPSEGDTVSFMITIKNNGPNTAHNVVVGDTLPTGLDSVLVDLGTFIYRNPSGWYQVDSLVAGDSVTALVEAEVAAGTAGKTLTNFIKKLSQTEPDPVATNDQSAASVTVAGAPLDIALSKTVSVGTPRETDTVTFTLTAQNLGSVDATSLVVRDSLVAPFVFVTSAPGAPTYSPVTGQWNVGTLPAGGSANLIISAVLADGSGGTVGTNTASVLSLDQADVNGANDVAAAAVSIQKRTLDIEIQKTADVSSPLSGSAATFTVRAINRGPGAASNVTVLDTIQPGLTLNGSTPSAGTTYSGSSYVWTIPALAAGDTATLDLSTTVTASPGGAVTNRAWLGTLAQSDTFPANNADSVTLQVPVSTPPVVTIATPADGANFDPGDTIAFSGTATDAEDGDLTSSIVWTSDKNGNIGTGGSFSTFTLSPGPHTIAATVTDLSGTTSADSIQIVLAIVGAPTSLNVPFGGSASLPISLSAPAPAGGLSLTVTSADPAIADPTLSTVTIPAGSLAANATIQGLQPGITTVTVTSTGYGSATTSVSVSAALNITQGTLSFPQGFGSSITVRLESQGVTIAAPAGGLDVTLTPTDATCLSAVSPVTIPAGQVQTTAALSYGGSATLSCATYLKATAPSLTPDSVRVTVTQVPPITVYNNSYGVGSGLQTSASIYLGAAAPSGGTTVRVESSNPAALLIAPDNSTPGTAYVDFNVPSGYSSFTYFVQGVEGQTDTATVTATAPLYTGGSSAWNVVQPGLYLISLGNSTTTLSADDPFQVRIGVPYSTYVSAQQIRPGGTPVTARIQSGTPATGVLTQTAGSADTALVTIPVGAYDSPTTVAAGGVAFDPLAAGTTDVSATIPGFIAQPQATQTVTVSAPTLTVYNNSNGVGSGLQTAASVYLGTAAPAGGVTVRVESSDPATMLIAPDANTPGTAFVDFAVPAGYTSFSYYTQGVEGQTGTVTVTASAPAYTDGTTTWSVVQPGLYLIGLTTTTTTLSGDDPFQVRIGVPYGTYVSAQQIRAGGTAVTARIQSATPATGVLTQTAGSADTAVVTIPVGSYDSPTTVATGGVAFDALAAGTTDVSATIPGFIAQPQATQTVTVSAPALTVYNNSYGVGSGLQTSASVYLGTAAPAGGVTVRVESSDPATMLISPDANTPGSAFVDFAVPAGYTSLTYYTQGLEGQTGTVTVTATAPAYTDGTNTWSVVQPGLYLIGLNGNTTTLAVDDPFQVRIGVPYGTYVSAQQIRAGGSAVTATITSSKTAVGQFSIPGGSSGTATVTIPVGGYDSPSTVAAGGVAFDALTAGATDVAATIPGFIAQPQATQTVTVSAPTITLYDGTVASGLQTNSTLYLQTASPTDLTVRIQSSAPGVLLVSPDASTAGTGYIDLVVPAGYTSVSYYVQGVEGQTGTATLTASAPAYTDGSSTWSIVQPALVLSGLNTTATAGGADDAFYVTIGYQYGSGVSAQAVRAGGTGVTATLVSSIPAVGSLVTTGGVSGTTTVQVPVGAYRSVTTGGTVAGGVSFRPLTTGTSLVSATIPGFIQQPAAAVNVTVN